jgi:hypothetical protein
MSDLPPPHTQTTDQVALILLPIAFCYDVFWVFIQPLLTHSESVMVRVRALPHSICFSSSRLLSHIVLT